MTRPAMRAPCDLIITVVLVSIIFYSLSTEAMILSQTTGAQNPPFGPDSSIIHAVEGLAELGTTYTTTSPGTWHRVLRSGSSPYYTTEPVGAENDTLADAPMEFERPIQFDDPEEANTVAPIAWNDYPAVGNQHDLINDNVDSSIMEEPSPVQTIFDDFERQQQDAMMSTTEPSSFEFPLASDPVIIDDLFNPPFCEPIERSTSPLPSSLADYPGSVSRPRLSPETNDGEIPPSQSQGSSITQKYLSDTFNFGDRYDPRVGFERTMDIVRARFEGEHSPLQPQLHPYPTSIPPEVISITESIPSTPVIPSGKKVYFYHCLVHDIRFNKKEHTIEHFQTVHGRIDVTMTNAHPCTHAGCTSSFRHPKDLVKHRPKHTGQKNFDCVCSKTYTRSDNLLRHQNGCEAFKRHQQHLRA